MDENELVGADPEEESGAEVVEPVAETTEIVIDTSQFASEIAVLEERLEILTQQVVITNENLINCYCMLLILAVLGLKNVFRSIIRKVMGLKGGTEDV